MQPAVSMNASLKLSNKGKNSWVKSLFEIRGGFCGLFILGQGVRMTRNVTDKA